MTKHSWTLALNRCPHGHEALSIDYADADGGGGGARITGPDCCGRWKVVKEWPMGLSSLRNAAESLSEAADELEQEA